jgi:hypothetical protein
MNMVPSFTKSFGISKISWNWSDMIGDMCCNNCSRGEIVLKEAQNLSIPKCKLSNWGLVNIVLGIGKRPVGTK